MGIRVLPFKQLIQLGTTGNNFYNGHQPILIINQRRLWRTKQSIMMDRLRLMRLREVLKTTSYSFKYQQHIAIKRHALRCVTF